MKIFIVQFLVVIQR